MKVIDLLNKIANGEEVPKEVEYKSSILHYNSELNDYCCDYEDDEGELHGEYLFTSSFKSIIEILNDEVEILEEEKKIPEKLKEFGLIQYNLDYIDYKNIETLKEWLNKDFQTIYDALDLLVKNQNKLIDYLKSKGE